MKKVVFVGGTSFSGSTFFQLTLANSPTSFACGEVRHLFRPTKKRHLDRACGCGDPNCAFWARVKQNGEDHLYESIFELHPEVDTILDASKNIHWIRQQSERLSKQGIEARHILIWKMPLEFAYSLRKRNRLEEMSHWPRYHKLFYSAIPEWRAVQYGQYAREQDAVLQATCRYLGIDYREGMEHFWEKTHHVLGGNLSSRIHLYGKESSGFKDVQSRAVHGLSAAEKHRRVYYEQPDDDQLQAAVDQLAAESPELPQIEKMLRVYDVFNETVSPRDWPDLRLSPSTLQLKRLRLIVKDRWSKVRLGQARVRSLV